MLNFPKSVTIKKQTHLHLSEFFLFFGRNKLESVAGLSKSFVATVDFIILKLSVNMDTEPMSKL